MTKDQISVLQYVRDNLERLRAVADREDLIIGDELGDCIKECNKQIVESRHPISLVHSG